MRFLREYIYDAEGRRVAEGSISAWSCDTATNGFTVTANYVRDQAGHQLSEFTPGQGGTMAWQHTNVYANGELIATEDNTEAHFYLNDWLGTRRVQTDYLGVPEQTCSSLPYGDGETCAPTPTENLFTGKERDSESGNDYFGARYYGSSTGRFLSPDWSDDPQPVPYAALGNPQTLNLYGYVVNDPLGIIDPDGHLPCGGGPAQITIVVGPHGSSTMSQSPDCDVPFLNPFQNMPSIASFRLPSKPLKPPTPSNKPTCTTNGGNIVNVSLTTATPTTVLGALIGSLFGPEGTATGAVIGSSIGVGGDVSYVPQTRSWYVGMTVTASPLAGGVCRRPIRGSLLDKIQTASPTELVIHTLARYRLDQSLRSRLATDLQ